ncbi:IclR family transcriptional regulator [Hydrogenophaga sp.]|uniref:IclR family transcriptional regulator n=1 Tax=Hydrogenophaga sp. TaxID=1904254 RepID=UPI002FC74D5A
MTTSAKVLQVLGLFTQERKQIRASDVIDLLDTSPATAYRYMADLEEAGLIERSGVGQYVLGPTVVELDRQIRINDPLIAAAADIMRNLSDRTGGTALLSRWHGRKVICVHQTVGRFSPQAVSYERGRAMPLYRGATSKIILAHLEPARLRDIIRHDAAALRKAGLPASFGALSAALEAIRANQICHTAGEVDPDVMGWAAPIRQGHTLLGSLSVVMAKDAPVTERKPIPDQVLRAALRIEGRLEQQPRHSESQGESK